MKESTQEIPANVLKAWMTVQEELKQTMSRPVFGQWLGEARVLECTAELVTIGVGDEEKQAWLEARLASTLQRYFTGALNQPTAVEFVLTPNGSGAADNSGQTPEEVWQTAMNQLDATEAATSLLQKAQFLAYYQDRFVIGLPTPDDVTTAETWRADLEYCLTQQMDSPDPHIHFVVTSPAESTTPASPANTQTAAGFTASEAEILIKPIRTSLREVITRPRSVVLVPAYLLRWLPYLGVDQGWFLVAMRQAFYQAHGQKVTTDNCGQIFTVSRKKMVRWSGLGDQKVWGYLKSLDAPEQTGNFLAWFMQAKAGAPGKPRIYSFRADMPLTPDDVEALTDWLQDHNVAEQPLEAVEAALQVEPRDIWRHPAPAPRAVHQELSPQPQSVQEVVLTASRLDLQDPRYLPTKKLADDLQLRLQSPTDNLLITHYFILEWLRKLGRIPAWIVTILRDRGYIDHTQGIRRDRIRLEGGYDELAQALSVSQRQVESWLPPLESMVRREGQADPNSHWARHQAKRSLVTHFLEKEGQVSRNGGTETSYEFIIRLEEPLTPEHQQIYDALETLFHESLLTSDPTHLQNLSQELEEMVRVSHKPDLAWSAKDTAHPENGARSTQLELPLARESHTPRSADHTTYPAPDPRIAPLKALLVKHINPKVLKDIQQLLHQHLETLTGEIDCFNDQEEEGGSWDWEKLLGYSGVSNELRTEILQSPELRRNFLGQVFYGYEQRVAGNGKGIKSPFRYAARRYRDAPPPEYLELAGLPPAELAEVLRDETLSTSAWISEPARRLVSALRRENFLAVVEEASQLSQQQVLPEAVDQD